MLQNQVSLIKHMIKLQLNHNAATDAAFRLCIGYSFARQFQYKGPLELAMFQEKKNHEWMPILTLRITKLQDFGCLSCHAMVLQCIKGYLYYPGISAYEMPDGLSKF